MPEERFAEEQAAVLGPNIDKLLTMMGAARDAFNRHSRTSLQELQNLAGSVAQDFSAISTQLRTLIARKPEAERSGLTRLLSILSPLEVIGQNLGGLTQPIEKKIKDGVLFSDKAVTQVNYLFDQHAGMVRSILDIVKTDNGFLKKFVLQESRKLVQACTDFATEHEDRLIEGLCLPQAAPIFLAVLDRFRTIGEHEMEAANLLTQKP
jgi:Na+/phosphate symporter